MASATRARKALLLIGVFTLTAIVAVLISLPSIARSSWFKEQITEVITAALGRPVHFNGGIALTLGLSPTLKVTDFQIENLPSIPDQPLLRVGSLEISGPLFRNIVGKYQIDSLRVTDVFTSIARDENGASNWDLGRTPTKDPVPTASLDSGPPHLPIIRDLSVHNAHVSLKVGEHTRSFLFEDLSLKDIVSPRPGTIRATFEVDGHPLSLRAQLDSINGLLKGSPLAFDLTANHDQHVFALKGSVRLDGTADVQVTSSGPDLKAVALFVPTTVPDFGPYEIRAHFKTAPGVARSFAADPLRVSLGEDTISGNALITVSPSKDLDIDLTLESGSNRLLVKGDYAQTGALSALVEASGGDLSELSSLIRTTLPAVRDFSIKAKVTSSAVQEKKFNVQDLELHVGPSDLTGSVEVEVSPLLVNASLSSSKFDLVALSELSPASPESTETPPLKSHEVALPFELLEGMTANVNFKATHFLAGDGLAISNLMVSASAIDGVLSVPSVTADVFGGSLSGDLRASKQGSHLTLRGQKFAANPITLLAGGTPFLNGDFDLSADLTCSGETLSALLNSLSGGIQVRSDDAQLQGSSLHAVASGLSEILSPILGSSKEAKSECLLFDYQVKNGIARSDGNVIKLGEVFIFAKGEIDFPKNELSYSFHVNSKNPSLASLIPPFRGFGKLNNLHFVPSVSGSVASVLDTSQGIVGSAFGALQGAAHLLAGIEQKELSGIEVCKEAFAIEQRLLSSRFGSMIDGRSPPPSNQPAIDSMMGSPDT